eukprot:CAMPEP_0177752760 /NCGR_PEP_ID=MMETSP0491_2-20121128/1088_1 /TAXON_ID=63592 /ORGANISM="Tetraselmis chuii, Strain PLY429" /LENGTH=237 /DNA_ID=CAMNT_0019267979 /DNA_START=43 /DNA_END=755 /DNA_ORIENTATION=-
MAWPDLASLGEQPVMAQVVGSGIAFTGAFLVARFLIFPKLSFDFANRSISIVHSLVALFFTARALDLTDPLARVGGQPTNDKEIVALAVSLGYFTYDTICCMCDSLDVVGNLHHVATIAGLVVGVFNGTLRGGAGGLPLPDGGFYTFHALAMPFQGIGDEGQLTGQYQSDGVWYNVYHLPRGHLHPTRIQDAHCAHTGLGASAREGWGDRDLAGQHVLVEENPGGGPWARWEEEKKQ